MTGQQAHGEGVRGSRGSGSGEPGSTVRLQVRLTPVASLPGFYARVSGGQLDMPVEFSDKAAFVQFLERVAERGPGRR